MQDAIATRARFHNLEQNAHKIVPPMEHAQDMAVANGTLEFVPVWTDGWVQHALFGTGAVHLMLIVETGIEAFALLGCANVNPDGPCRIVLSLVQRASFAQTE